MVTKRQSKNIRLVTLVLVAITVLTLILFNPFVFVSDKYPVTIRCDKETGCTQDELDTCTLKQQTYNAQENWVCSNSCFIRCSDTSEMRRRDNDYDNSCDVFSGGGALVEAVARCTRIVGQEESRAKTVCSDGTTQTFNRASDYPNQKQWEDWDVYWASEIDKLEERKERCSYACRQVSSVRAECIDSPNDVNNYVRLDHKGCFAISGRFEVWWFDSENKLSQIVEVCDELCENGKCTYAETSFDDSDDLDLDLTDPEPRSDCIYGPCESEVTMICKDGTEIIAYTCEDGCAKPQSNACPDGSQPVSSCKSYEIELSNGQCKFSVERLTNTAALKELIVKNPIIMTILGGFLMIGLVFIITKPKKRGRK